MNNPPIGVFVLSISSFFTILAFCLLARVLFFLVNVDGLSMYPTLNDGDRVLALRYWPIRWLRRGHIVILQIELKEWFPDQNFKFPHETLFIKRIVGLPGDIVTIDFQVIQQYPIRTNRPILHDPEEKIWHIPSEHCFVMGDSPGIDSTIGGPVPFHAIRGVVLTKLSRKFISGRQQTISEYPTTKPGTFGKQ